VPEITVLIPVYNGMPYIVDAVKSVLNQTFRDFELLIINDGSTDGTADFLNSLNDSRIRIIHQENRGLFESLIRGFREASAEWVARLDSDDIALPNRLEKQYNYAAGHPEAAAVFSSYRRIGTSGKTLGVYHLKQNWADDPSLHGYVTNSTMLCNKSAFFSVGGYKEAAYPVEDLDLPLRLQERYKLGVIEEPLTEYRYRPRSNQVKHLNTVCLVRRYVRFCALKRRQGMPEPPLVKFLEHDLELPILKRLFRMVQDQGELYRRLAIDYMLDSQTFRGLFYLLLALPMDPKCTLGKILSLSTGLFRRLKR
jgi:glycosyltransferase involved in cell wall biosynthesis